MIMPPVPGFSAGTVGHFDGPSVSFTEARGTGEMASWLKIALAVVLGAMAIAVLYLLIKFFLHLLKLLIVVFRWTFRWLLGFDRPPATGAGYRDEIMAVERALPKERGYVDLLRRWIDELLAREPRWEQLGSPAEKVRYLYRRRLLVSMRRGYEYKPQLTPRETEHDLLKWRKSVDVSCGEIVPLYEQARYGDGEPDPERVERLREQMRKSGYHP
jgi:hypothetical protein